MNASTATRRVVIGMDPHKRSATIEVMTADENIVGGGRFATDGDGYAAMCRYAGQWPDRVWAIEGCAGIGKHIAVRLLADGEEVVDVPPKLSARARVFATGQGRKTDATDAHSVALVGTRMTGLRPLVTDEQLEERRSGLAPDDPINIQYTSGTTGFPKGATLTHRNILNNGFFVTLLQGFQPGDRLCIPVPFYHCFGMVMGNLGCTTQGATMVIPADSFEPTHVHQTIEAERCTALGRPLSNTALSRTERAHRRCDVDDLVTIAAALGIPPTALLPEWTAHSVASHSAAQTLNPIQGAPLG